MVTCAAWSGSKLKPFPARAARARVTRSARGSAATGALDLAHDSIALCLGLWVRAKTVDQDHRDNAERRALFVGLWPPMFWLVGVSLQELEG